jgi:hypothetical protein
LERVVEAVRGGGFEELFVEGGDGCEEDDGVDGIEVGGPLGALGG